MIRLVLPITALLGGVAFLLLGSGLLSTLLAVRGNLEGFGDRTIGLIMSSYFLGYFVGTYVAIPLILRIGHIRAFAFCAAIAACTALGHTLIVNPWVWMALRVLMGMALVTLYTVIESWLNSEAPPSKRGQVFAIYMAVNLVALALAQQLIRLDEATAFSLFALASILISAALLPVTWTRLSPPQPHQAERLPVRRLFAIAPVAAGGAVLSGLAMGALWGLGPLYASRIGQDEAGVALFMSAAILGGALLQWPLGRYSDTHDRRSVLATVCALAAVAALLMPPASGFGLSFVAALLYGCFAFAVYPICVAHLIDHLPPEQLLGGSSGLLLLHGVGAAIGPAVAGSLMGYAGPHALPAYFALMQSVLAGFAWWSRRGRADEAQPAHFVAMVRTSPLAMEMMSTPEEQGIRPDGEDARVPPPG